MEKMEGKSSRKRSKKTTKTSFFVNQIPKKRKSRSRRLLFQKLHFSSTSSSTYYWANKNLLLLCQIFLLTLLFDSSGKIGIFVGHVSANSPPPSSPHHEIESCFLETSATATVTLQSSTHSSTFSTKSNNNNNNNNHHSTHHELANSNSGDFQMTSVISRNNVPPSKSSASNNANNNMNLNAGNQIVVCHIRTLNADLDLEALASSLPLPAAITRLKLLCNDVLFFESVLNPEQLKKLNELQELTIEKCKLKHLPSASFNGLYHLRKLTIETGNSDWAARSLEMSTDAFSNVPGLKHLNLGFNHMWNIPEKLLCQLSSLQSLNLTHNLLSDMLDLGLPKFVTLSIFETAQDRVSTTTTSSCLHELKSLDLSHNNLQTLGGRRFETMRRLLDLRIEHNVLENLADESFYGLSALKLLNLSSNKLVALPSKLFNSCRMLKELDLRNNSIQALSHGLLSTLEHLEILDLSSNQLSTSSITNQDTFKGLVRLIILNLANNQIMKLSASTFVDLNQVQNLNLENNQISSIEDSTFQHLNNLHTLNLARNKLLKVSSSMLDGLFVLSKLSLDYNLITDIEIGSFRNCTSLQDLGLVGNQFNSVPEALQGLALLKTLDIGENLIASLSNDSFAGLGQLYGLRIVGNRLSSLPRALCDPLKRLRVFNLAQNRISSIGSNTFTGCPELRVLLLNSNSLEEIPSSFPSQLSSLLWLNVSENRITELNYHLLPTSLEWIDVSHNQIGVLNGAWVTSASSVSNSTSAESHSTHHLRLRVVDASHNQITQLDYHSIPVNLEALKLGNNKIGKVASDTFGRSTHLRRVELYGNQLENLALSALRLSTEHNHHHPTKSQTDVEFFVGGNPFLCDCELEWLTKINAPQIGGGPRQYPIVVDLDAIVCRLPYSRSESRIPLPAMKSSDFLCKYESICFSTCHCCGFTCDCEMTCSSNCSCYHDDNWSANVVDCSTSAHTSVPNNLPMDSTDVYLDGNNIPILKSHTFIGRKNLKTLFLNNSNIHSIANKSFNGLQSLKILHLEANLLTKLEGFEFDQLTTLNELYLHDNVLEVISNTTFLSLKSLEILRLDGNHLVTFSVWQLSLNPYLVDIGIARNRWNCGDCAFLHQFYGWVTDNSKKIMDLVQIRCVWNTTMEQGPHLMDYNNTCESSWTLLPGAFEDFNFSTAYPLIIIISLTFLLIITTVGLLICRDAVRVWIFSKFGVRLCTTRTVYCDDDRNCHEHNCCNGGGGGGGDKLIYDSYFIYSEKDEEFITRHITDDLETVDYYRLCLQHRDLMYSNTASDLKELMTAAAESSKSITIFLSRNFFNLDWTSNEYRSAVFSVIKSATIHNGSSNGGAERPKNIMIVFIESIPELEISPDLKSWLRNNKAHRKLHYGNKRFWQTFKYLLPDPSSVYQSNITSHTTSSSASSAGATSAGSSQLRDNAKGGGGGGLVNYNCEDINDLNALQHHQQQQNSQLHTMRSNDYRKYGTLQRNPADGSPLHNFPTILGPQSQLVQLGSPTTNPSSTSSSTSSPVSKMSKRQSPPLSSNSVTVASETPNTLTPDDGKTVSSSSSTIPSFLFQPNDSSPVPMGHFRGVNSSTKTGQQQHHNNNHSSNNLAYNDGEHVYSTLDPPSPQHHPQQILQGQQQMIPKQYQKHFYNSHQQPQQQQQQQQQQQHTNHIHLPNGYTYSPQQQQHQWKPHSPPQVPPPSYSSSSSSSSNIKGRATGKMSSDFGRMTTMSNNVSNSSSSSGYHQQQQQGSLLSGQKNSVHTYLV